MSYCVSCGAELGEGMRFCVKCGMRVGSEASSVGSSAPESGRTAPLEENFSPQILQTKTVPARREDSPIGCWGYFGLLLIFSLPVIGWIVCILAACGVFGNRHISAFARGVLLYCPFGVVIATFLFVVLFWVILSCVPAVVDWLQTADWRLLDPWEWREWWRQFVYR